MTRWDVPSMEEVAKVRGTNGLSMVSTFSGAGGSCLGFEMAGFDVRWASEFVEAAREVYVPNHPDTILDARDIRKVTGAEILDEIGLGVGELDVLEGSPPCASFSISGKREKLWGKVKKYSGRMQRTDDLFWEFERLLIEMQPKMFVAENVGGMVMGKAKGFFKLVMRRLADAGYRVRAKLLDAQWLGVPQRRRRLIFVGVRTDLEMAFEYPKPMQEQPTLGERLAGLEDTIERRPDGTMIDIESGGRIDMIGCELLKFWSEIQPGEFHPKRFGLHRTHPNEVCSTLNARLGRSVAGPAHWSEPRRFSLAELRRIAGFPDDFKIPGRWDKGSERLGRAVPPLMMRAVAERVREALS